MTEPKWWPLEWLPTKPPMATVYLPNGEAWTVHDWRANHTARGYFVQPNTIGTPEDVERTNIRSEMHYGTVRKARVVKAHLCADLFELKAFLLLRITVVPDE